MLASILQSTFTYPGFAIMAGTGILLGILHTIMPCEDKFIFCFYAFGVAKDGKQAIRILNFYGLGLLIMNLIIGTTLSYIAAIFGHVFTENLRNLWIYIGSLSMILSGIIMLIQLKRRKYWPHSEQLLELTDNLPRLKKRKRTSFLLGMLAGIPPCVFEIAVYSIAIAVGGRYGWGNGTWITFFFGIGTWIGLYPLAIFGTMGGKLSQMLKTTSFRRLKARLSRKAAVTSSSKSNKNAIKNQDPEEDYENKQIQPEVAEEVKHPKPFVEFFSGAFLILLGMIILILSLLDIDLVFMKEPPELPPPFNWFPVSG